VVTGTPPVLLLAPLLKLKELDPQPLNSSSEPTPRSSVRPCGCMCVEAMIGGLRRYARTRARGVNYVTQRALRADN